MKKGLIFLIGLGLIFTGNVVSYALSFSDTYDFSGSGIFDGCNYLELDGKGDPFIYSYTHTVTFDPPADSITSAEIILSHHNNSDNPGELWFLYQGTSTLIGELDTSTGPGWVAQHFTLPPSLYGAISGGSWSLQLSLQENTSGTDKIWITQSVLLGTYSDDSSPVPDPDRTDPVPEPASMFLLGFGLIGLAGYGRRKFLKK